MFFPSASPILPSAFSKPQKRTCSHLKLPANPWHSLMPLSQNNLLKTRPSRFLRHKHGLMDTDTPLSSYVPYSSENLHRFICALSPLCLSGGKESQLLIYQEEFCFVVLLHIYFNQQLIHLELVLSSFPRASHR